MTKQSSTLLKTKNILNKEFLRSFASCDYRLNVVLFQEPSMLHKRCYISVAVLEGRIYALGGMNGEKR